MTNYLGIDPGLDGGFVVLLDPRLDYRHPIPPIMGKYVMPTINISKKGARRREIDRQSLLNSLQSLSYPTIAAIEEQIPVRNQNIKASYTTAKNYGMILMALTATGIRTKEVSAHDWHSHFGIVNNKKGKGKTTKAQAFEICRRLYPNEDFRKSERSKVFHDGIVDAVLIAEYCKFLEEEGRKNGHTNSKSSS